MAALLTVAYTSSCGLVARWWVSMLALWASACRITILPLSSLVAALLRQSCSLFLYNFAPSTRVRNSHMRCAFLTLYYPAITLANAFILTNVIINLYFYFVI